ncbi:MAG: hypothetical protein KBG15_14640 [Kofleriaceae bacterium]|nr:hypothetical protein [Kofleriaceae bacterium]
MQDIVKRFAAQYGPARHVESKIWGEWRAVWSAGDPGFSLLDTDEANQTGGVSPATLAAHGWPTTDETALLDYVPVLDLIARLDDDDGQAFFDDALFPENLPSILAALPSASHLVGSALHVSWARTKDCVHAEIETTPAEDGPSVTFSFVVARCDVGFAAGIFGRAKRAELASLFGIATDQLEQAPRKSSVATRDW